MNTTVPMSDFSHVKSEALFGGQAISASKYKFRKLTAGHKGKILFLWELSGDFRPRATVKILKDDISVVFFERIILNFLRSLSRVVPREG